MGVGEGDGPGVGVGDGVGTGVGDGVGEEGAPCDTPVPGAELEATRLRPPPHPAINAGIRTTIDRTKTLIGDL